MPTGCRRFDAGEVPHALHAMHVTLTKDRGSLDAQAVISHWNRDWPVETDHADLDVQVKASRSVTVEGKDHGAIRIARLEQVPSCNERLCSSYAVSTENAFRKRSTERLIASFGSSG